MNETRGNEDTVTRETLPTAAFSIRGTHIRWIAQRAKELGVSKSAFVRDLLDRAMGDEGEKAA